MRKVLMIICSISLFFTVGCSVVQKKPAERWVKLSVGKTPVYLDSQTILDELDSNKNRKIIVWLLFSPMTKYNAEELLKMNQGKDLIETAKKTTQSLM